VAGVSLLNSTSSHPGWLRLFRIIVGLIAIAASIYVLVSPGVALYTLVLLLSFALLILGASKVARSISHKLFSKGHRVVDLVTGILAIVLGGIVLAFPLLGIGTLIFLLAFASLIYGIGSIVIGAWVAALPKWSRALHVLVGLMNIVFSFLVIAYPAVGAVALVIILSVSFMVSGIESIISAIE